MKHPLRTLSCLLLSLSVLLSLAACKADWREDLSAAQVCQAITNALTEKPGWRAVGESYISPSSWGEDYATQLEKVKEYRILVSEESDVNIDEVGVFLCRSPGDIQSIRSFVQAYLSTKALQQKPLLESYNPGELPKLDNAKVQVVGLYVVYTILSTSDTATADTALKTALTPVE